LVRALQREGNGGFLLPGGEMTSFLGLGEEGKEVLLSWREKIGKGAGLGKGGESFTHLRRGKGFLLFLAGRRGSAVAERRERPAVDLISRKGGGGEKTRKRGRRERY